MFAARMTALAMASRLPPSSGASHPASIISLVPADLTGTWTINIPRFCRWRYRWARLAVAVAVGAGIVMAAASLICRRHYLRAILAFRHA
jgi:ABC-type Fe3+-siderophore transport system permease subunit